MKKVIAQYIAENEAKMKELSLIERVIRVEEELKALREVQISMMREMNARFEAIDKRFETLEKANQQRFEAIEKRFDFIKWLITIGFSFLAFLITLFNFLK